MADQDSLIDPNAWPVSRWVGIAVGSIVFVILTAIVTFVPDGREVSVSGMWPDQLAVHASGTLPVTVRDGRRKPVGGAEVELLHVPTKKHLRYNEKARYIADKLQRGEAKKLSAATTDESGHATLTVPPTREFVEKRKDDGRVRIPIVLRVRSDRGSAVTATTFQAPKPVDLALTTDRPLYEPGQTMLLRITGVAPISGSPVEGEVEWEIRDPRDNPVFKKKGSLSKFGITSTRFELADRATPGEYTIEATVAEETVTRTVDVRHFRLPRFRVEVEADGAATAGEKVSGTVKATYNWGAPVANAEVELALTAPAPGNVLVRERMTGETNEEGAYTFDWKVPEDAAMGTRSNAIEIRATVSTEAGRAAEGEARVPIRTDDLRLEVLPTPVSAEANFIVVLRTARGEPVADAAITLQVPEPKGEREIKLTTDQRGVATFEWEHYSGTSTIRAEIEPPDRTSYRETVSVSRQGQRALSLERYTASVGDELQFHVESSRDEAATVIIRKRGMPLRAGRVTLANGRGSGTLKIPPKAAGLAYVVALGSHGLRGSAPIWVRQKPGDGVRLETDRDEYRPGQKADIALSYPPASDVAFALFGVDEALYALEERTDLPLPILLHESADAAQAAARAFGVVESAAAADDPTPNSQMLAAARFYDKLGEHASPQDRYTYPRDLTDEVADAGWRTVWTIFSLLVAVAALLLLVAAGRLPWEHLRSEDFNVGTILAVLGGSLAIGLVGGFVTLAGGGAAVLGGAIVWFVTVFGFFIAAIRQHGDLRLGRWLALVAIALVVAIGGAVPWANLSLAGTSLAIVFRIVAGVGLLLVVLQAGAWVVILNRRDHWSGALGMLTLFWTLVACGVALVLADCAKLEAPMSGSADRQAERRVMSEPAPAGAKKNAAEKKPADAGGAGSSTDGPRVRSYFPETMVWEPEILADGKGRADLSLKMPDSITTWRLTAMAQTADGRFAESDHPLVVRKPFFLSVELPPNMTAGDRIDVPVTVSNESSKKLRATVDARASDALEVGGGPSAKNLSLEGGERQVISIPVRARAAGIGSLEVSATVEGDEIEGDAVQRTATVRPDGRKRVVSRSGIIGEKWTTELPIPTEAFAETLAVDASVSGSAVADAFEGLDAMLRRPDGCFEQTSSINYPNVMILRRLEQTKPQEWPGGEEKWLEAKEKAERLISLGYQRMLSFRTRGGGFRIYPKERYEPDVMLTAYGLMQMADMDGVMEVDLKPLMRETAGWLTARQNDGGTWPVYASGMTGGGFHGEDVGQVRSTAFVAWALMQIPEELTNPTPIEEALDHVEQAAPDVSDPNALAIAANALLAGNRKKAARGVLDRLASNVERGSEGAYWSPKRHTWIGGYGRYADIETTAIAANALSEADVHVDLLGDTLRYLAEARAPRGGWGTTQATVWALRAFQKLRKSSSDEPVDLHLYAGGRPMTGGPGGNEKGTVRIDPDDQRIVQFESLPESAEPTTVRVDASASTNAMARATAYYAVPWDSPHAHPEETAFELDVEIEERRAETRGTVKATATLRNRTETHHGAAIVELPIPPGGWVDRQQFEDMQKGGAIDHYEVTPTHVRLYLSDVGPRKRLDFHWEFTPTVAGDYALPPVRAYPFYAPRPRSETDAGDLRVRD